MFVCKLVADWGKNGILSFKVRAMSSHFWDQLVKKIIHRFFFFVFSERTGNARYPKSLSIFQTLQKSDVRQIFVMLNSLRVPRKVERNDNCVQNGAHHFGTQEKTASLLLLNGRSVLVVCCFKQKWIKFNFSLKYNCQFSRIYFCSF